MTAVLLAVTGVAVLLAAVAFAAHRDRPRHSPAPAPAVMVPRPDVLPEPRDTVAYEANGAVIIGRENGDTQ